MTKDLLKKETFQLIEPAAEDVLLVGDFTNWEENPILLKRERDGIWKAVVPLRPGNYEYRFIVDGNWRDDTKCVQRRANAFGTANCVREVAP